MLAASRIVPIVCSGSLVLLALLAGCGPQVELETDATDDTAGSGSTTAPDPTTTTGPTTVTTTVGTDPTDGTETDPTADTGTDDGPPVPTERWVDILFVVDNSGSMGEEQAKLSTSIASLLEVLDTAEPPVAYRIGVTTTDNGNPWCGTTSPEAGNLRATSCRERPQEFVFDGAVQVDVTQAACYDLCSFETLGITNGVPWIEIDGATGTTNLSGEPTETLRCMLPQGIDGCGFESQLESTWKAIRRAEDESEDEYGFRREGALLAVMLVTDEEDCSYNSEWETIFLPDGNRVFWSDPMAAAPTSAVCWHAGVACTGDGNPYAECHAVDLDVDGNEVAGSPDDEAVLHPLDRYTGLLADVGAYVFAIDGVAADGSIVYALGSDPVQVNDYGIGPGCESADGRALPPVRVRETVESISGTSSQSSICVDSLDDAYYAFAQGILGRLP